MFEFKVERIRPRVFCVTSDQFSKSFDRYYCKYIEFAHNMRKKSAITWMMPLLECKWKELKFGAQFLKQQQSPSFRLPQQMQALLGPRALYAQIRRFIVDLDVVRYLTDWRKRMRSYLQILHSRTYPPSSSHLLRPLRTLIG
jgi:hypothetical protein